MLGVVPQHVKLPRVDVSITSFWKGTPAPAKFGDQVTADHIVAYAGNSMGVTGRQAAVVFWDRSTGYFDGFPLIGKAMLCTVLLVAKRLGVACYLPGFQGGA